MAMDVAATLLDLVGNTPLVRLGRLGREDTGKPLLAAALGVLILQLLVIIPVVGWVIAAIAGLWGAGALAYYAFAAAGGRSFEGPASTTGTEAAPA